MKPAGIQVETDGSTVFAMDLDALKAAALDGRESLIAMTQALVRVDSQTPPSDTQQAARVAASFLSDLPGTSLSPRRAAVGSLGSAAAIPGRPSSH